MMMDVMANFLLFCMQEVINKMLSLDCLEDNSSLNKEEDGRHAWPEV